MNHERGMALKRAGMKTGRKMYEAKRQIKVAAD